MFINQSDIDFIHQLQSLGEDNVYLGGSLMLAMIGVRKTIQDIDVVIENPNEQQSSLIKEYNNRGRLDFLRYRLSTPPDKNLRYMGIPIIGFESLIKFKIERGVKKDYLDLFTIIRWILTQKPEGVNVEDSILTILKDIEGQNDKL
jgi:hypothetical protein